MITNSKRYLAEFEVNWEKKLKNKHLNIGRDKPKTILSDDINNGGSPKSQGLQIYTTPL